MNKLDRKLVSSGKKKIKPELKNLKDIRIAFKKITPRKQKLDLNRSNNPEDESEN